METLFDIASVIRLYVLTRIGKSQDITHSRWEEDQFIIQNHDFFGWIVDLKCKRRSKKKRHNKDTPYDIKWMMKINATHFMHQTSHSRQMAISGATDTNSNIHKTYVRLFEIIKFSSSISAFSSVLIGSLNHGYQLIYRMILCGNIIFWSFCSSIKFGDNF